MSNSAEILDFLRVRFARTDELLGTILLRQDEMMARLSAVERDIAGIKTDIAAVNARMDNMDRRLARVERRLDLIDGTAPAR